MADDVAETVASAFRDVSLGSEPITPYAAGEPLEDTEPFRGRAWQDISPEILAESHYALSWFTPRAFQYYLPAFMIGSMHDPKAAYVITLLMFIRPTDDQTLSDFRRERWRLLDEHQIEALEKWLEWHSSHSTPNRSGEFEDAAEVVRSRYWW